MIELRRVGAGTMGRALEKNDAQRMKEGNRLLVLRLIRDEGPLSRVAIARRTGLSPTTVSVITDGLMREGLVHEVGHLSHETGGAGRRPVLLDIRPDGRYIVAVDLGVTNTSVALYDLGYRARARRTAPTPRDAGPDGAAELIATFVEEVLEEAGVAFGKICGIGFGVPGLVDTARGISVFSHNLGWRDVPFKAMLEARFGVPVFLENVIRMTTLAEKWLGAGKDVSDLICIGIGSGLGAGIVMGGKLYRGPHQGAGEIGHTVVVPGGPRCRCGNRGCLEALVTGPGIARRARELVEQGEPTRLSALAPEALARLTARDVAQVAREGDELARRVWREAGTYLGLGIANMINLFDIPFVILGGGIAQAGELLFEPVIETVREHTYSVRPDSVQIVPRALGPEASLLGAALLVAMETLYQVREAAVI